MLVGLAGTMTSDEIAAELGETIGRIRWVAQQFDISLRVETFTGPEKEVVRQLRSEGMPLEELADKFECSISAVRRACDGIAPDLNTRRQYREFRKAAAARQQGEVA